MILAKPVLPKCENKNASNLKLLHGLSVKLFKLFQFYFQDLNVFFILLQLTLHLPAYGRWNARNFELAFQVQSEVDRLASVLWISIVR